MYTEGTVPDQISYLMGTFKKTVSTEFGLLAPLYYEKAKDLYLFSHHPQGKVWQVSSKLSTTPMRVVFDIKHYAHWCSWQFGRNLPHFSLRMMTEKIQIFGFFVIKWRQKTKFCGHCFLECAHQITDLIGHSALCVHQMKNFVGFARTADCFIVWSFTLKC